MEKCSICEKTMRRTSLKKHLNDVHNQNAAVTCHLCHHTFATQFEYSSHMKEEEKALMKRKGQCNLCSKKCSTVYSLKNHIIHVHRKPMMDKIKEIGLTCPIRGCGKTFSRQ